MSKVKLSRLFFGRKVLSLNLWDVGQALDHRDSLLVAGLDRLRPDIVCMQEVSRHPTTQRIRSELFAAPHSLAHHLFSGLGETDVKTGELPRNMEGLSILSRYPALRQATVTLPYFKGDVPRQVLLAEFAIERRTIVVATERALAERTGPLRHHGQGWR